MSLVMILSARPAGALDFPEQAAAKYREFAYSSVFGFSGDVAEMFGSVHTDSMLALTDADGDRRVHRIRTGRHLTGLESGFAIGLDTPGDLVGNGNHTAGDRSPATSRSAPA